MATTIGKPKIDRRPKLTYMGIRTVAPFKGMSKAIGRISRELSTWIGEKDIKTSGPPFLRFHVIDMRGFMDISFCFPVRRALSDDGEVKADFIPAGRYASLIYSGAASFGI
jgi:effector-binding domain-containing protein